MKKSEILKIVKKEIKEMQSINKADLIITADWLRNIWIEEIKKLQAN